MNKWRPKGWKNPYLVPKWDSTARASDAPIFEAGADAMLDKVCEKMEKAENPHDKTEGRLWGAFEESRDTFLRALRE